MQSTKIVITVEAAINAPIEKVWYYWTSPEHVIKWNQASDDWHCPNAENDLSISGKFSYTMAAKEGSFSFDFWGIYDDILENELLMSTLGDGRKLKVTFASIGDVTQVVENFEAEDENPIELQQTGWQTILENFKIHVERN